MFAYYTISYGLNITLNICAPYGVDEFGMICKLAQDVFAQYLV